MKQTKKTCNIPNSFESVKKSHNNKLVVGQNKCMIKKQKEIKTLAKENSDCKVHVMPPMISDDDISALLNGIVGVMRRKIELENQAEIINMSINMNKVLKELKEKTAECNRLKNEILFLKSKLNEN